MSCFALLFPGQGAQVVGMGKDLAESFPQARALFDQADRLLGIPLSRLCFEGPLEELTRTEICQPAIFVASLAALAALNSRLQTPDSRLFPTASAGLSLGEYTALTAAGALSLEDGLRLVALRAKAMEEASHQAPGTMASILGLELVTLQEICQETGAEIANVNSPEQIVISGPSESVRVASEKAREKGAKRVVELQVGGAFHSRLMDPASLRLKAALKEIPIRVPRFPVLSNVTASAYTQPEEIRRLLAEQLTSPVQWEACVRKLLSLGIRSYLELGPGTVLKGLLRKIDPQARVLSVGTASQVREAALSLLEWS